MSKEKTNWLDDLKKKDRKRYEEVLLYMDARDLIELYKGKK